MLFTWPTDASYGFLVTNTFRDGFLTGIGDLGETWQSFIETRVAPELSGVLAGTDRRPDFYLVHMAGPQYGRNATGYCFDNLLRAEEGELLTQAGTSGIVLDPPGGPYELVASTLGDWDRLRNGEYIGGEQLPMIGYFGQIDIDPLESFRLANTEAAYIARLESAYTIIKRATWDAIIVDLASGYDSRDNQWNERHPGWQWLADKARDPGEPIIGIESIPKWAHRFDYAGAPTVCQPQGVNIELQPGHTRKMSPVPERHKVTAFLNTIDIDGLQQSTIDNFASFDADFAIHFQRYRSLESELPPNNPPRWTTPPAGYPLKSSVSRPTVDYNTSVNASVSRFANLSGSDTNDTVGDATAEFQTSPAYTAGPDGKTQSGNGFGTSNGNGLRILRSGAGPYCVDFWARTDTTTGTLLSLERSGTTGRIFIQHEADNSHRIGAFGENGLFYTLAEHQTTAYDRGAWHHYSVRLDELGTPSIEVVVNGERTGLYDGEHETNSVARVLIDPDVSTVSRLADMDQLILGGQGPVADIVIRDFVPHIGFARGLFNPTFPPAAPEGAPVRRMRRNLTAGLEGNLR